MDAALRKTASPFNVTASDGFSGGGHVGTSSSSSKGA